MPSETVTAWHERRGTNKLGLPRLLLGVQQSLLGLRRALMCMCVVIVLACGVVTISGGRLPVAGRWVLQNRSISYHPANTLNQTGDGLATRRGDAGESIMGKEYERVTSFVAQKEEASVVQTYVEHRIRDPQPQENLAKRLQSLLTEPAAFCKKLIRVGGRSCLGAYDGSKVSKRRNE